MTASHQRNVIGNSMAGELIEDRPQFDDVPTRGGYVESQTRGEIDVQIATAKRFPRSIKRFVGKATELATLDDDTAASCFYTLPRDGKNIEGPSARLAEIVAASWGNIRAEAHVVSTDGNFVTVRGVCWDLENNVAVSTETQRRITNKQGRRFSDDMIVVTSNAACSIALRNAIFKVVPMALVRPVYAQARLVAIGNAATLSDRRQKMVTYFSKMGVRPEQVCEKLGRAGVEDITLDDLATMLGISTAIKEGDTTVDEQFPTATAGKPAEKKSKGDELADSLGEQSQATAKASGKKHKAEPPAIAFAPFCTEVEAAGSQRQLTSLIGVELPRSVAAKLITEEQAVEISNRANERFAELPAE